MATENQSILDILDGGSFDQTDVVTNTVVLLRHMYAQISDLKEMMTALMNQVESISEAVDASSSTQSALDNLRTACQLMSAKVDATATPVTSFVSTFNNNI
jgi:hypothetical protein